MPEKSNNNKKIVSVWALVKKCNDDCKIAIWALVKNGCWRLVYNTQKFMHRCPQGHMVQWIKALVRSSDIPKKSVSSIPGEGSGELSEGKLTGDNR